MMLVYPPIHPSSNVLGVRDFMNSECTVVVYIFGVPSHNCSGKKQLVFVIRTTFLSLIRVTLYHISYLLHIIWVIYSSLQIAIYSDGMLRWNPIPRYIFLFSLDCSERFDNAKAGPRNLIWSARKYNILFLLSVAVNKFGVPSTCINTITLHNCIRGAVVWCVVLEEGRGTSHDGV